MARLEATVPAESGPGSGDHYQVLSHIYLVGYSISLVALVLATTIFIYFK